MRKRNFFLVAFILLVGTRASFRDNKPVREPAREISERSMHVNITAYTSSADECGNDLGVTSSGELARDGVVACNFLPFGTRINIPALFGKKEFVVKDRMAKHKNNFVDVWVASKKAAFHIGRSRLKIVVLGL